MELIEHFARKETLVDATVLLDFSRGDTSAFEKLFREFQTQVHGWITRIVRDPAIAEDLTVETFWRIHRARARFDPRRSFGAWARRIATHAALDYLKTRRVEVQLETVAPITGTATRDPALQMEVRQKIEQALRSLPPKLQAVAALALIEEREYDEIADALGVSVAAVKSRMFRAVRILRKKLERQGITP